VPKEPKITVAVVSEFAQKAEARLGKNNLTVDDWLSQARESEERGRYYAAAVYYHIASLAAAPAPKAEMYRVLAEEMQDRMIFGPEAMDDDI
jgi:hypothetical protein